MLRHLVRLAAAFAVATLSTGGVAAAQGVFVGPPPSIVAPPNLTGKRKRVARELTYLGFGGTDVALLSDRTVALLDNAIHSRRSQSGKQARVASILSGGGILQRGLDRLGGR